MWMWMCVSSVMQRLRHANIVKFLGTEIAEEENRLFLLMEYVNGGSLKGDHTPPTHTNTQRKHSTHAVPKHIHTCIHTYVRTYTHIHKHTHAQTHTKKHTHTHIKKYVYISIYLYIYICIYICMCVTVCAMCNDDRTIPAVRCVHTRSGLWICATGSGGMHTHT